MGLHIAPSHPLQVCSLAVPPRGEPQKAARLVRLAELQAWEEKHRERIDSVKDYDTRQQLDRLNMLKKLVHFFGISESLTRGLGAFVCVIESLGVYHHRTSITREDSAGHLDCTCSGAGITGRRPERARCGYSRILPGVQHQAF
jgi:hypothetical protein